jgi:hypothetical protein
MNLACPIAAPFATDRTLPFPNHVHRFDSLQRPRPRKRAVPLHQPSPLLHRTVVLLNDVVEVLALK